MIKTISAKLGGMRKPQTFVVYPRKDASAPVMVQSERSIGQFDPLTGRGVLNYKGSGAKYSAHLHPALGAEPFTFPADFVEAAKAAGVIGQTVNLCP